MFNRVVNYFRQTPVKVDIDPNQPIALYFAPSGKVSPITLKSMSGWGGYDALQQSISRPNSNGNAAPTELGYAYISEVNVWVRRCIEIRAQNIARLDWYVEDKRTGKRVIDHPLMVAINRSRHFFLRYERSMDIWGEVFLKPVKNMHGYYSDVWWLNNLSVNFNIVNGAIDQFYFVPLHGGKPYVWSAWEMAYLYNENSFDDLHGSSRILSVLAEANVHEEISRSAQAHFANDARPGIMLLPEVNMGIDQAQELVNYWKANFQGSLNTNKPVMLPTQIKSVQVLERATLKDDVELRGSIRREICAAFGVPLSIAGAWDDANYQSAPEQRKSLYEDTIIPEAEQISKDLDKGLLPFYDATGKTCLKFDAKKLLALAEDLEIKKTSLTAQLTAGGITLNQYREALDMEAIPEGNVYYIPSSVIVTPVEKIGTMPPPAPPGGGFGFNSAPDPAPPLIPPEDTAKSGNSVSVVLSLANNADCVGLQKRLKELYAGQPITWTDPNEFHITLVSVPSADEQQAGQLVSYMADYMTQDLRLPIGSLASFDSIGEHALHFRIRRNSDLLELQEDMYIAARNCGMQVSSYSEPRAYIPHVTMGYAQQKIRAVTFNSKLAVSPVCMTVSSEQDGSWQELGRKDFGQRVDDSNAVDTPLATKETYVASNVVEAPLPAKFGTAYDGINQNGDEPELGVTHFSMPAFEAPHDHTHEPSALDELDAYEKFCLNRWGKPTRTFQFNVLAPGIVDNLTHEAELCNTKAELKQVVEAYRMVYKAKEDDFVTPEQAQEWWADYDKLLKTLGNDWLRDYMREVWRKLEPRLSHEINTDDVKTLLTDFHPELIDKWTGTADEPGVIAKLYMAGMGAGQAALQRSRTNMNPAKAIELDVDWQLVPSDAIAAVQRYVGKLIREIDGTTLNDVQRIITQWLESGGTIADLAKQLDPIFNDAARAELIARTESSNAYNSGAINRWQEVGVEQVRWMTVNSASVCDECSPLNNQVSTIEQGFGMDGALPPKHPNCILPGNKIQLPGALLAATKSLYIGRCVKLTLENGRVLTVTENHPILTTKGWIKAQFLNETHQVVSAIDTQGMLFSTHPNDNNVPIAIEQIFDTFMESGNVITATMPIAAENFYGDGGSIHGDVNVVYTKSLLLGDIQTEVTQPIGKCSLCGRNIPGIQFNPFSSGFTLPNTSNTTPSGGVSSIQHSGGSFGGGVSPTDKHSIRDVTRSNPRRNQTPTQGHAVNTELFGERLLSLPGDVTLNQDGVINISSGNLSNNNVVGLQDGTDAALIDVHTPSDFLERFASDITPNNILGIEFFTYHGDVYDLQIDKYELYICNGVVVKNCRCFLRPVL